MTVWISQTTQRGRVLVKWLSVSQKRPMSSQYNRKEYRYGKEKRARVERDV